MKPFLPKAALAALAALVCALPGGSLALQGQILLAEFNFSDAPTSLPPALTSTAETVAPGFGTATFSVVRNNTTNVNGSGIANIAGSSNVGAAQISGQQNTTYGWEVGSNANFFQFTLNFGSVPASAIEFGELVLLGRTGVEWNSATGELASYNSARRSSITVRSSLDGYAANIGGEITPSLGTRTTVGQPPRLISPGWCSRASKRASPSAFTRGRTHRLCPVTTFSTVLS